MSFGGKPNNAAAEAELQRREAQAKLDAENTSKALQQDLLNARRRRSGRSSLIRNVGGELGTTDVLGQ